MNNRFEQFDILRGLFFIPMFIFHLFSFYDLNKQTDLTDNSIIHSLGLVRNLYIILAGFSVYLSYKAYLNKETTNKSIKDFYNMRLKRSMIIGVHALIITIISHYLHPQYGIKFGILHFIALSTLLITPLVHLNNVFITLFAFYISTIWSFPKINPFLDTITGASVHFSMADWFPIKKNMKLILLGLLLAQIFMKYIKVYKAKDNRIEQELKWMGENSLELYTSHIVIIMIVYWLLHNKK